jgi:anti-sigma B factor antagonist
MSSFYSISDETTAGGVSDDGAPVILGLIGEIDYAACPQLRERLAEHIDAGRRHVVVDMSQTTFIDSTAIGVLLRAARRLRELDGGSLLVVCPYGNAPVTRIFEITGIDSALLSYPSRKEALSSLAVAG